MAYTYRAADNPASDLVAFVTALLLCCLRASWLCNSVVRRCELKRGEAGVETLAAGQRCMGSLLDDAAILNNQNSVGVDHGCEPMGNDNAGAAFRQCLERSLNRRFAFGIQRRGCLIQKQNWRVLENGARDCDALALAAGQGDAAFADRSVQAIWQIADEAHRSRHFRRLLDIGVARPGP